MCQSSLRAVTPADQTLAGPGNNICKYGPDRVKDFCATAGLKLVIRAHECVQDGYQYFASCHLITVFSATNYCARYDNDGAFLEISIDRQQVLPWCRLPYLRLYLARLVLIVDCLFAIESTVASSTLSQR